MGGHEVQELRAAAVHLGGRRLGDLQALALPRHPAKRRQVDVGPPAEGDGHRRGPTPGADHRRRGTGGQRQRQVLLGHAGEIGMVEVELDPRRLGRLEAQARPAVVDHLAPQVAVRGRQQRSPGVPLAAGQGLHLAQLLEGVDADLLVGPDGQPHAGVAVPQPRQVAVAEVALGRRAGDDDRVRVGEQRDVVVVDPDGVHDARARAQEAGARQQRDRRAAVLGLDLGELAPLLGGVDVADEPVVVGVARRSPPATRRARPRADGPPPPRARARGRARSPTPAGRRRARGRP